MGLRKRVPRQNGRITADHKAKEDAQAYNPKNKSIKHRWDSDRSFLQAQVPKGRSAEEQNHAQT